jgi:hypothetical protein
MTFDALDRNTEPLVRALDEKGIEKHAVGVIPFTEIITGLEDIDRSRPTMFYGSTRLAELAAVSDFTPNVFYRPEWFDPTSWKGKRTDLLNEDQVKISAGQLRRDWVTTPTFIKSVDPKVLTGMVLEGPDRGWWAEEYTHIPDEAMLVMSPVRKIKQEWRFFIVDRKPVAASQYKHDGVLRIKESVPFWLWDIVWERAQQWMPAPDIVMDVCDVVEEGDWLNVGELKVLEFNCLIASGFYNANPGHLVEALEYRYGH